MCALVKLFSLALDPAAQLRCTVGGTREVFRQRRGSARLVFLVQTAMTIGEGLARLQPRAAPGALVTGRGE